jgi:hypothetical protein
MGSLSCLLQRDLTLFPPLAQLLADCFTHELINLWQEKGRGCLLVDREPRP